MTNYYSLISDKLNLDMKDSEFYLDESGITPPDFYYEGCDMSLKGEPFAVWNQHSVLVHNDKYYMYGTRAKFFGKKTGGFDVYTSEDLENWSAPHECFNSKKYGFNHIEKILR